MTISRLACFLGLFFAVDRLVCAAEPVALTNNQGGALVFSEVDNGWRWTGLRTPAAPDQDWAITDNPVEVVLGDRADFIGGPWELAEATADKVVLEQRSGATGLHCRRVFSFGTASNAARMEVWVRSADGNRTLTRVGLLDVQVAGETFREMGAAPVSFPVFGQAMFFGIEHISGESAAVGDLADRVQLQQRPRLAVDENWQLVATVVVGWPQPGVGSGATPEERMREAFLRYLDTVRVKPPGIVLHTDTWWTVPLPLNEKNVLNDIDTLRKAFAERTGMFFDTYAVDLGWSDPKTFWRMETGRFPNELRAVNDRLASAGARMGLWVSPGSGYPDGLSNTWLQSQGYEMSPFPGKLEQVPCFALGGRYQREFKERIVGYAQQYELGHVILDFMLQRCDVPTHGHPVGPESRYAIDAGLADVLDGLRAVNPGIVLEPMVCGYPPSPWWLMKTPFVLGPAGDDMPYGRGPSPEWLESLITARDIAYRAGQEAWIMPTQALETFDIIVLTPGEFQNTAVMAIGRGRWFLSTYFKSELMKPEDWDFLAALVRWARENKSYLGNAWQFGGHPENREAYGYMFRNAAKDLYCVRNPWIEPRTITLPVSTALTEARDVRTLYPRRSTIGRIAPGDSGLRVQLGPYETLFLETAAVSDEAVSVAGNPNPEITVASTAPHVVPPVITRGTKDSKAHWLFDAAVAVPDGCAAELCVLVEGGREVSGTNCKLSVNGREVTLVRSTSVGQFGAAIDPSPENWIWFTAALPAGGSGLQIDLTPATDEPSIGVFLRGSVAADNDPAPEGSVVFPTFRPERRTWSQPVLPVRGYTMGAQ